MYSNIPGVQILISLLKQYNITHLVISPGTRNTPLVHSVENDDFFTCYSVVDERSAGFFALGLSEALQRPVCVTCTAATATCNYMPAIKEAYERNIQLVALTADQDTYSKFNMGDQNIDQINMYNRYVKYAVDVPKIQNENDYWYFNRCVNEAFTKTIKENGPIQINFRMDYDLKELSYFPVKELPRTRYVETLDNNIDWEESAKFLKNKKVLFFCGSENINSELVKKELEELRKKINLVVLADNYSNLFDSNIINPSIIGEAYVSKGLNGIKPDLIIMTGAIIYSPIKVRRKIFGTAKQTWQISEDGRLVDGFRNVKRIYKISTLEFLRNINKNLKDNNSYSSEFSNSWKNLVKLVKFPELDFTHFNAIKKFIEKVPENSLIHMSVLDSIRISNYFKLPFTTKCFANIGADGIDGALSTFLGQALATKNLAFLLVGDLSLMYDMNGLNSDIPNNVRILVINNYAGSEFHKNFGLERIPTLNKHIAAGHITIMKDVASISNLLYLSAINEEELKIGLEKLIKPSQKPIILEVFTDADKDAKKLKEFWNINTTSLTDSKEILLRKIYDKLGKNMKENIRKILERK